MNAYCIYTNIYDTNEWENLWNTFLKDYSFEGDDPDYDFLIVTKDFPDDQPSLKMGELVVLWMGSIWAYEDLPWDIKCRTSVQNGFTFRYDKYTRPLSKDEFLEKVGEWEEYHTICSFYTPITSKVTLQTLETDYCITAKTFYKAKKDFANFVKNSIFAELTGPCYENIDDLNESGIIITEFQNVIDEPDEGIFAIHAEFHEKTEEFAVMISDDELNELLEDDD